MKHAVALTVLASFASLAGWSTPRVASADPKPEAPAAVKHQPKRSFWLASDPHVPLAVVDGSAIRSVGNHAKTCGTRSRWAKPESKWRAVDAWGQVTGVFEVAGSQRFDVTGCNEVYFTPPAGLTAPPAPAEGAGLFVSADSAYKPAEPARWTPSEAERAHLDDLDRALDKQFVDGKLFGKKLASSERTKFFTLPASKEAGSHRPRSWAVMGGPVLVVAYLSESDPAEWKVSKVLTPLGLADSYRPLAVFDMNGDGLPEIVYHMSDGPTFADNVLALDPGEMSWSDAAESPGGSTL